MLREFIKLVLLEALDTSINSAIDALPILPGEHGFGPQVDPNDVVDIESIFKQKVKHKVYGIDNRSIKLAIPARIPANEIIPVQDYVFRSGVKRYAEDPPEQLPLVILDNGSYFAQDHTRIAAQIMNGKEQIDVRLLKHVGNGRYERP